MLLYKAVYNFIVVPKVKIFFESSMSKDSKQIIRERIKGLLKRQDSQTKQQNSLIILRKLFNLEEFKQAKTLFFYASFNGEVETFEMIRLALQQGKKIGLPRILSNENIFVPVLINSLENDIEIGPYGIQQPKNELQSIINYNDLDMVIVPGIAFDKNNNRLGRGGGYYDRFLKNLSEKTLTVGLAFDFQILSELSCLEPHDLKVLKVLTN